jgi:cytochrome oxidase Cu insertion factor (SCO1/SenC/PrrC family)
MRWCVLVVAAAACAGASAVQAAADPGKPQEPRMEFAAPAAGSYELQRIQPATDATLLDAGGRVRQLTDFTQGKITLLTFFYTYCVDPWGCPYAYWTLSGLRDRLIADPQLARQVRFVSVSFDPTNDTPDALRRYGAKFMNDPRLEWQFLTAPSVAGLLPLLDGFGQDVRVERDADGNPTRTINHMLKMFLIDPDGMVREIYSLAFLQQAVMLNDMRTLALERPALATGRR